MTRVRASFIWKYHINVFEVFVLYVSECFLNKLVVVSLRACSFVTNPL